MYQSQPGTPEPLAEFRLAGAAMRYSVFVPRLYNLCRALGMRPGQIMPSRAFCSDESQGYPIILIAKHFGAFPFNHGRAGGVISTDRHGPHAHHGQDMVIVHASHVGYEPETGTFGRYRRLQTATQDSTASCGKIQAVVDWYTQEYRFAQRHVQIARGDRGPLVIIDNLLLRREREDGLILRMPRIVRVGAEGQPAFVRSLSTARVFRMAEHLASRLHHVLPAGTAPVPIGERLTPDLFYFRRRIESEEEGRGHLERNLAAHMPEIVTAPSPPLTAATINTQVEFDRTYRTLVQTPAYQGKRVLFVSGLNVDVSPTEGHIFPLTEFIPWAAYWKDVDGQAATWEQDDLLARLNSEPTVNPDQVDLEAAIREMEDADEVRLKLPGR